MNFIESQKSFPRPWVKFYDSKEIANLEYVEDTLFGILKMSAIKHPDHIAIEYMYVKYNYKSFLNEVLKAAYALKELGIRKGDRVTICLPNIPQAVMIFYGVLALGGVCNMIHPLSTGTEIEYFISTSNSKLLFILDSFYEQTKSLESACLEKIITVSATLDLSIFHKAAYKHANRHVKLEENERTMKWQSFIKLAKGKDYLSLEDHIDNVYSDVAAILYSGGTTGLQKGIELTHLNFNALSYQTLAYAGPAFTKGDRMLVVLPMFHGFGLGVCVHTCIYVAATMILVPRFNADSFAKLITKENPNFIAGVPTLYEAILRKDRLKKAQFKDVKGIFSGGDKLPHDVKMRFDALLKSKGTDITLREGYGLTECVTASCLTPRHEYRVGSVGIPYPDTLYKIVKLDTIEDLPPNEEGEICIHGPTVMKGYLDNEEETNEVLKIHDDGRLWLHTGDLGYMDEDGFVYFILRIKRMIKTSGYSVYPAQIEEIINKHPYVSYSCVIGIPDKLKIETIKACIVLKEGYEKSEELKEEIFEYCNEHIARYQTPRIIEFYDALPMTKVGKIAYKELEKEHQE